MTFNAFLVFGNMPIKNSVILNLRSASSYAYKNKNYKTIYKYTYMTYNVSIFVNKGR